MVFHAVVVQKTKESGSIQRGLILGRGHLLELENSRMPATTMLGVLLVAALRPVQCQLTPTPAPTTNAPSEYFLDDFYYYDEYLTEDPDEDEDSNEDSNEFRSLDEGLTKRPRSRWWTALYTTLLAASTTCLIIFRFVILTDAGELGVKAAGIIVGPRRKRLLVALSTMSSMSSFAFALELWLLKRITFALAATVCFATGILGAMAFFRYYVYKTHDLDSDLFRKYRRTHKMASVLVFFDTELTPVLPWTVDRRLLMLKSDGFPDQLTSQLSVVFVLVREISQLTIAALNIFISREWEITSIGNFLMGILEIVKLVLTRCRFAPRGCCTDRTLFPSWDDDEKHPYNKDTRYASDRYIIEEEDPSGEENDDDDHRPLPPLPPPAPLDRRAEGPPPLPPRPQQGPPPLPPRPEEDDVVVEVFTYTHRIASDVFPSRTVPNSLALAAGTLVHRMDSDLPLWSQVTTADGKCGLVPSSALDEVTQDVGHRVVDEASGFSARLRSVVLRSLSFRSSRATDDEKQEEDEL